MEQIISNDQCQQILNEHAKNGKLLSTSCELVTELNGLVGKIYKLTINYIVNNKEQNKKLIVKTPNTSNKTLYEISKSILLYEKECFFLRELLPLFEYRGLDTSFAPKGFFNENDLLVMEDLSNEGFLNYPKNKPLDLEHLKIGLNTLAHFHTTSIIYGICLSKENGTELYFKDYAILRDYIYSGKIKNMEKYFDCGKKAVCELFKLEFPDQDFREKIISFDLKAPDKIMGLKKAVIHGDLWSGNILFKYKEDKPVEAKLIDYQCVKYGPVALDVLQFIFANTGRKFREDYMRDLLQYYYEIFSNLLYERALFVGDILPRNEYVEACERLKIYAKFAVILDRSITCLPDEAYLDALKDDQSYEVFLYEDRSRQVLEGYENVEHYRELLKEDVEELKSMFENE